MCNDCIYIGCNAHEVRAQGGGVLRTTQAATGITELVTNVHHVDPQTEKTNGTNEVINRISLRNKENNKSSNKQKQTNKLTK